MASRRVGLFGGTFDPPHVGHLAAAVEVRHALGLDEVRLVVANDPWQKSATAEITPAEVRLEMVRRSVEGVPGLVASDVEVARGGATYTADTLEALATDEPDTEWFLILGADAAARLPTWNRADEVRERCRLVVVARNGDAEVPEGWSATVVAVPRLDVSSSALRSRVAAGAPVDVLVAPGACAVIRERRLYGGGR